MNTIDQIEAEILHLPEGQGQAGTFRLGEPDGRQ